MDSDPDDSFDDVLATIDVPTEPKQIKLTPEPNESNTTNPTDIKKSGSSGPNTILVNPKQRGNPLLQSISKVPWVYEEIIPDYIVGATSCILFLSLQYHNLNPDYIQERLKKLGKMFTLRVLLVQIDVRDPHKALKHLTRICLLADLTLMLAWNASEAGSIVETYKLLENKAPTMVMERPEQYPHQKLVTALTNVKPVNKTDAMTLLNNYKTLENIVNSSEDKLSLIPGLGPRKAKKIHRTFNEPFLK